MTALGCERGAAAAWRAGDFYEAVAQAAWAANGTAALGHEGGAGASRRRTSCRDSVEMGRSALSRSVAGYIGVNKG